MLDIKKIGIIGAGTMGHGIAEVSAISRFNVVLVDVAQQFLERARSMIDNSLEKLYQKKSIQEDPTSIISRIKFTTDYSELKDADFVIEAVPERFELKIDVFRKIDELIKRDAIFATNTSSIPITELAESTSRKEQFIGMHFFNPPPLMKLVEIIPGKYTSNDVIKITTALANRMGKVPVVLKYEVPGFVSNRIFIRLLQEACREVESNEADIESIDYTYRDVMKLPMGIFELADYVGIDVVVDIWNAMEKRGFISIPCKLFTDKVAKGLLGVKSGAGFYNYPAPGRYSKISLHLTFSIDPAKLISLAVNEAAWLIENDIVTTKDIDTVMKLGFNFPKGLLQYADEYGLDNIYMYLKEIYEKTKYEAYKPLKLLEEFMEKGYVGVKSKRGFYSY